MNRYQKYFNSLRPMREIRKTLPLPGVDEVKPFVINGGIHALMGGPKPRYRRPSTERAKSYADMLLRRQVKGKHSLTPGSLHEDFPMQFEDNEALPIESRMTNALYWIRTVEAAHLKNVYEWSKARLKVIRMSSNLKGLEALAEKGSDVASSAARKIKTMDFLSESTASLIALLVGKWGQPIELPTFPKKFMFDAGLSTKLNLDRALSHIEDLYSYYENLDSSYSGVLTTLFKWRQQFMELKDIYPVMGLIPTEEWDIPYRLANKFVRQGQDKVAESAVPLLNQIQNQIDSVATSLDSVEERIESIVKPQGKSAPVNSPQSHNTDAGTWKTYRR